MGILIFLLLSLIGLFLFMRKKRECSMCQKPGTSKNYYSSHNVRSHDVSQDVPFYTPVQKEPSMRWERLGTVMSSDEKENTVFTIEYRRTPVSDEYEYRVKDTNDVYINLQDHTKYNNNGNIGLIPGYEGLGSFILKKDSEYSFALM